MCTWELVCCWGTLSLCSCLCIQDEDRVYSWWIYFLFGLHLMLFMIILKNIVGYQLEDNEDSLWAGFNCHDLIVNSCFQLLHILLWCSYENFILDQDNNFYQIEYLSILITCLLNNVWVLQGEATCSSLLAVKGLRVLHEACGTCMQQD